MDRSNKVIFKITNKIKKAFSFSEVGVLIALILISVVLAVLSPQFLTYRNLINILLQISIIFIIATGMTFVIITGGIDLSVGSIVAVVGLIVALLIKQYNLNVTLAVIIGLLLGSFLGAVNGIMIAKFKIPAFIATLGMMSIGRGLTYTISGGQCIFTLPENFLLFASNIGPVSIPVIIMIIVSLIAAYVLKFTRLGRYTYAVGGNETAATLSGINVDLNKIIVYTISGLTCAIGGIILTARLDSATPVAGVGYELDVIAAVIIGGTSLLGGQGNVLGTLLGALIIGVVSNGMNLLGVASGPQEIVKGLIIVVAVGIDILRKRRF